MGGKDAALETASYLNKWTQQKVAYNKRDLLVYAAGIGCDEANFT
jgi:hypothetical protein